MNWALLQVNWLFLGRVKLMVSINYPTSILNHHLRFIGYQNATYLHLNTQSICKQLKHKVNTCIIKVVNVYKSILKVENSGMNKK